MLNDFLILNSMNWDRSCTVVSISLNQQWNLLVFANNFQHLIFLWCEREHTVLISWINKAWYTPASWVVLSLARSGPLIDDVEETEMYLSRITPLSIPKASSQATTGEIKTCHNCSQVKIGTRYRCALVLLIKPS